MCGQDPKKNETFFFVAGERTSGKVFCGQIISLPETSTERQTNCARQERNKTNPLTFFSRQNILSRSQTLIPERLPCQYEHNFIFNNTDFDLQL